MIDAEILARLSRIELSEDELDAAARFIADALERLSAFAALKLEEDGTPPEYAGMDALREDRPSPGADAALLLAAAPEKVGGFYAIPKVVE